MTLLYIIITSLISISIYLNFADFIITKYPVFFEALETITYLISFLLFFLLNKKFKILNTRKGENRNYYNILVVLGLGVFYFLFSDIVFNYKYLFEKNIEKPIIKSFDYSIVQNLFISLNTLVLAPILEEYVFRRTILNSLLKKKGVVISILFSSLLFSLIHINFYPFSFSVTNFINANLLGLLLGIVYYRYGFFYSILLHFIFNLFVLITNRNSSKYWDILIELNFGLSYWLIILFSLALIFILTTSRSR